MKVFTSPFQNPFLNLALEDYFLRGGVDLPIVFFYVNRPCVVLGRFQNPWVECNLPYLVENGIWLVRRQSGGGCVYHDQGNINFSFITNEPMVDRKKHVLLLQEAFSHSDIPLTISPRNDLWLNDRKISGSAYKQTKNGSFHHGTFLVSSNLNKLEESLKHTLIPKSSKSIASVRSKVTTLQEYYPDFEISDVIEIVAHKLETTPYEIDGTLLSIPDVQQNFSNLRDWEWLWGETPTFELEEGIVVRKGLLEKPPGGRFSAETMQGLLRAERMTNLFPDFSEQHSSSSLIL
jgi:lipoate---protein ligase